MPFFFSFSIPLSLETTNQPKMNTTSGYVLNTDDFTTESETQMLQATYSVPWGQIVGYLALSLVILLGNAMVVVAVAKFHHLQTVPNMFVVGVAAMDMVFSISAFARAVDLIVPNLMIGLIPCLFRAALGTINATVNGIMLTGKPRSY